MDKGVKYIWDILKEVSEEQGRDYSEVKELWKLHREYVKEKVRDSETFIIEIPYIGNLYFSGFLYRLFNFRAKNKYEELGSKAEELYKNIEESQEREGSTKYTYPQKMRPNIYKLYKSINLYIHNIKKRYSTQTKVVNTIEEYSNNEENR